jgi:hypothetical protein
MRSSAIPAGSHGTGEGDKLRAGPGQQDPLTAEHAWIEAAHGEAALPPQRAAHSCETVHHQDRKLARFLDPEQPRAGATQFAAELTVGKPLDGPAAHVKHRLDTPAAGPAIPWRALQRGRESHL